jgi:2-polyprenyl-3-methyl-5-hydroxy-6-metoxy-1,4-benzoquinol methylase
MKNNQSPEQFYDSIVDEYDEMTDMERRFSKEMPVFQSLAKKYNLATALDAGSGTGVHSILLAQLGLQVTATDISEHMLHAAQKNAKQKGVRLETIRTSFIDIQKNVKKIYDAVFCLGNSLSHILKENELLNSLKGFYKVLNPGGQLFVQMLNYDRIMKNRERIQSIKEVNGKIFIRFYDYLDKTLLFNILTMHKQEGTMKHSLHSVEIFPWQSEDLVRTLKDAGYSTIQLFGNMTLNAYDKLSSKDLVILAQREGDIRM